MSNSQYLYKQNYLNNLPRGVTYDSSIARFFYNGKRFYSIKSVEWYRKYINRYHPFTDPSQLFSNEESGVFYSLSEFEGSTLGSNVTTISDQSGNSLDASSATPWILNLGADYYLERDGGTFSVTLPDMGTNATLAYVDDSGVSITGGLTIGAGSYDLPTSSFLGPVLVIDRTLDSIETLNLTLWLEDRQPTNWIIGDGTWDDTGVWSDTSSWQTA